MGFFPKLKRRNKKGSLPDLLFSVITLLVFGFILLIGFKIYSEFDTELQTLEFIPDDSKDASTEMLGLYSGTMDNSFLLLAVGLSIVVLVLAAMVRIHPIFIPLFFLAWVFFIFVGGILSNIFQEMAGQPDLIAQADQLIFISNILNFLPLFIGVLGIILLVVQYKTWQVQQ